MKKLLIAILCGALSLAAIAEQRFVAARVYLDIPNRPPMTLLNVHVVAADDWSWIRITTWEGEFITSLARCIIVPQAPIVAVPITK